MVAHAVFRAELRRGEQTPKQYCGARTPSHIRVITWSFTQIIEAINPTHTLALRPRALHHQYLLFINCPEAPRARFFSGE